MEVTEHDEAVSRHDARLIARTGGPLARVTLSVPPEVQRTYTTPGQYVSITVPGPARAEDDGYFVLASPVGEDAWQLFVRGGGAVADALKAAPIGTMFPTSAALGAGFPCDDARGRTLVVFAAGTGIAAAPPILARRVAEGDAARTHVYLGLRHVTELPLAGEIRVWRGAGAGVTVCISRDDAAKVAAHGMARGYVQDVARAELVGTGRAHVAGGLLFAVGPEKMVEAARGLANSLGMAESDVRTNY